jgi:hypothetical protein
LEAKKRFSPTPVPFRYFCEPDQKHGSLFVESPVQFLFSSSVVVCGKEEDRRIGEPKKTEPKQSKKSSTNEGTLSRDLERYSEEG